MQEIIVIKRNCTEDAKEATNMMLEFLRDQNIPIQLVVNHDYDLETILCTNVILFWEFTKEEIENPVLAAEKFSSYFDKIKKTNTIFACDNKSSTASIDNSISTMLIKKKINDMVRTVWITKNFQANNYQYIKYGSQEWSERRTLQMDERNYMIAYIENYFN